MKHIVIFLCFLLIPALSCADETEKQLKSFLESRNVIDQVYFDVASSSLSPESKARLDKAVVSLRKLSTEGYLLRVEGFASPEGDAKRNVNLSMYRAMAVRNYFRDSHQLNLDLFLTGYGGQGGENVPDAARRVDVAAYRQPEAAMALFDDQGTVEKIVVK